MIRLANSPDSIGRLFGLLLKPFVAVLENFNEDCGVCLEKAVYPGSSMMYGTIAQNDGQMVDRRCRLFLVETGQQWNILRGIITSYRAKTVLYAQTSRWDEVESYVGTYNPLFQELIELSPTKKVYGIKLEDLKRVFNCNTAWENKDWICIEESTGPIPGADQAVRPTLKKP